MEAIIVLLSGITLLTILMFLAKYYNNIRIFVIDVFHIIARIIGWGKKTSIKGDIELIAKKSIEDLNQTIPELQMPDMKIEWIKEDSDGKVRFDKNKAIVMLKFDSDRVQNVINSTSAYIHNSLLLTSRNYMDESILKAVDFQVIRKFLQNTPDKRFAVNRFVQINRKDIEQYNDVFNKVSTSDDAGLLTHILLREYSLWGDSIATDLPSPNHKKESIDVLDFVFEIATREYDDPTPLQYNHKDIKIAVLLVAKAETYEINGCRPYIRRIREGFANGIKTFYLLARGEKIEILKKVYGELIQTGNFDCVNNPQVYKDRDGRECICYCLTIDNEGDMAQDYDSINNSIQDGSEIELVVEHVYRDELKCIYNNNLHVTIPVREITDKEIKLRNFYTTGMTLSAHPINVTEGGVIIASIKDTKSNPQYMMDNQYAVGNTVTAVVQEAEDDIVRFLIKGTDMEAFAFRGDLTYSRYLFLHKLFPIGYELECEISDIDYVSNRLKLANIAKKDPWDYLSIQKGAYIQVPVYEIKNSYIASEINEGVKIVLPYSELGWSDAEIDSKKASVKRNQDLTCTVKDVDFDRRIVIVSLKSQISPCRKLYNSLGEDKQLRTKLIAQNCSGIEATTDDSIKVFIPLSETHIADNYYKYTIGRYYNVNVIDIALDERSLIGSFKAFIEHPLDVFSKTYNEGDLINAFDIEDIADRVAFIRMRKKEYNKTRLRLFVGDVSSLGYIDDFRSLKELISIAPMQVKHINYEKNCVDLSIKSILKSNRDKRHKLDYDSVYNAVIIAHDSMKYYVILPKYWIEGSMDISTIHHIGDTVSVRLAAYGSDYADFIED